MLEKISKNVFKIPLILSAWRRFSADRCIEGRSLSGYFVLLLLLFCAPLAASNSTIGSNTTISREGPFTFSGGGNRIANAAVMANGFTLQDASTSVSYDSFLWISGNTKLNKGTIYLTRDLTVNSTMNIVNEGIIQGGGHSVNFSCSSTFTFPNGTSRNGTFLFQDTHICFNSDVTVSTKMKFVGNCSLQGRGTILDLSLGSSIELGATTTLHVHNLYVRGVGGTGGGFLFLRQSGRMRFSNVDVQMKGNFTTTIGQIVVEGPSTWYLGDKNWVFSNVGTLSVDGVTLWKDSLNNPLASAGTISLGVSNFSSLRSGTIKQRASAFDISNKVGTISSGASVVNIPHQDSDTVLSSPVSTDFLTGPANSKTMRDHLYLAPNRKLRVTQSSLLTGSGLSIYFAKADEPLLIISAGVTFSLKNVILKNFSPRHVRYLNATTSNLIFDNGTTIELGENDELKATVAGAANTAITWTTRGSVLIKGFGNRLSLGTKPSGIEVEAQSTLTLHHIRLTDLGGTQLGANQQSGTRPFNLRVKHPSSRLDLRNSELVLSGNYTFSAGIMNVHEDNIISGTLVFAYTSSRRLTIQSRSSLMWDRGLTFSYASIPALTVDKGDNTKNKIVFTDASSVLHMNGCTLHSTFTPVKLTAGAAGGTWVVEDKCTIRSVANAAPRAAIIDQASLNVEVLAGATLQVDGLVRMS